MFMIVTDILISTEEAEGKGRFQRPEENPPEFPFDASEFPFEGLYTFGG